ncbi:MAG: hypothetical protein CVV27_03315 [Candidatus Melainabacteria bacterium HGW-Melainabacteria-1]|nr:MAG: hypothetical protein CVV27_03315 [Candidatus Melainabacteria bacterium HGW-Melainabacteria-1]
MIKQIRPGHWLTGLSLMLVTFVSLPALADGKTADPPPSLSTPSLQQTLKSLQSKGRLLSLDYERKQRVYQIRLLSPQGQLLRYALDPRSGVLSPVQTSSNKRPPDLKGLLSLEAVLQKVFGTRSVQLLEAELDVDQHRAAYEFEWLEQGVLHEARYDARTGQLIPGDK